METTIVTTAGLKINDYALPVLNLGLQTPARVFHLASVVDNKGKPMTEVHLTVDVERGATYFIKAYEDTQFRVFSE